MNVMALDVPREARRDWRSLPRGPRLRIKAPSEAAEQITDLLRRCLRDLDGKRVTPADCYHLAATVKLISDLRSDEILGNQMVAALEDRLADLEDKFEGLELINGA